MIYYHSFKSIDLRGQFQKIFPTPGSEINFSNFEVKEIFWSESTKGVIRGMHFQTHPYEQAKIVWVSKGEIIDVILDVRPGESYGQVVSEILSQENGKFAYIPSGFAHGFQVISESAIVNYAVDQAQVKHAEDGILWSSFDFDWPISNVLVSERDSSFSSFQDWNPDD